MFRFRRGKEPTTSSFDSHGHDHDHLHEHDEVEEALKLAESKSGRRKLLVGGIGNFALMGVAVLAAAKGQADPTLIEAAHNVGDTGYYMVPLLASMRSHIHSASAIKWMRGSSYAAATLAVAGAAHSTYEAVAYGSVHPELFTVPTQVALAVGNYAIARYVDKDPGNSKVEQAANRHAWADARTSTYAAIGNVAAFVFAPMNAISALFVAGVTIKTERTTINETSDALRKMKDATS